MPNSDYRWYTPLSQQFLENDYLRPGETLDERVDVICQTAERLLEEPGFAARFKANLQKGWYSLSTPIWVNFGTQRGLPISCFGSMIEDSMESILGTLAEVGMMTKLGGGTSAFFGRLRPRGSNIHENGESCGAVHFMQLYDGLINTVSQGKTRRGNFAAYLPIDHPDILEFLTIRSEGAPIQDLSFGVCIPDPWMEAMVSGHPGKRKVWAKVLECRANTGFPYLFFAGNANETAPRWYQEQEMTITHSNLCVIGSERVVTDQGLKRVQDLAEQGDLLTLFDGQNAVTASPMRLIERDAPVFRIETESGRSHTVTSYHKVLTDRGPVTCTDLKPGDRIAIQMEEGLFGAHHAPDEALLLGLYQADGTQTDEQIQINLWEPDFDLKKEVETAVARVYQLAGWEQYTIAVPGRGEHRRAAVIPTFGERGTGPSGVRKIGLNSAKLKQAGFRKGVIPEWIWQGDKTTQAAYLRGLYSADGTATLSGRRGAEGLSLALGSVDREFLAGIQILLSNLGIKAQIYALHGERESSLPDGHGGRRLCRCQPCWRLVVTSRIDGLKFEALTGFLTRKGIVLEQRDYRDNRRKWDVVREIIAAGSEDVYCCTVATEEHVWVCNSIRTLNCSEIMLPDNEAESFVCDLSSMNLLYFEEWQDTDAVALLVAFLDAVMTEFIAKAEQLPFMERAANFGRRHRALGIGWIGYHSFLQSQMLAFDSLAAKSWNARIARTIWEQADAASQALAVRYGEPEVLRGYGRRNATLCAIAPTKSSAFILGQVSEGIEPHRANVVIKDLAKGKFTVRNEALEQLLDTKGQNTELVWSSIMTMAGSVQHLEFLTEHEKAVFKTFAEISPMEIVLQAAQRQPFIDQGQSLNLMIHPNTPIKEVNHLLIKAWEMGVKSLYYQISLNAAQEHSRSILECSSCAS